VFPKRYVRDSDAENPEAEMVRLMRIYGGIAAKLNYLQSPFLLAIRLYWGWQFRADGLGEDAQYRQDHRILYESQHPVSGVQRLLHL
jgi:hypothetical protein